MDFKRFYIGIEPTMKDVLFSRMDDDCNYITVNTEVPQVIPRDSIEMFYRNRMIEEYKTIAIFQYTAEPDHYAKIKTIDDEKLNSAIKGYIENNSDRVTVIEIRNNTVIAEEGVWCAVYEDEITRIPESEYPENDQGHDGN